MRNKCSTQKKKKTNGEFNQIDMAVHRAKLKYVKFSKYLFQLSAMHRSSFAEARKVCNICSCNQMWHKMQSPPDGINIAIKAKTPIANHAYLH